MSFEDFQPYYYGGTNGADAPLPKYQQQFYELFVEQAIGAKFFCWRRFTAQKQLFLRADGFWVDGLEDGTYFHTIEALEAVLKPAAQELAQQRPETISINRMAVGK